MKKCPYCTEEIQSEAIKCKHCGEVVVSLKWRDFCERFATLPEDRQYEEWTDLSDDEKLRFRSVWRALGHSGEYHPQAPRPVEGSSNQGVPAIDSAPASLKKASDSRTGNLLPVGMLLVVFLAFIGLLFFYVMSQRDSRHRYTQSNLGREISNANVTKADALYQEAQAAISEEDFAKAWDKIRELRMVAPAYEGSVKLRGLPEVEAARIDELLSRGGYRETVYASRVANVRSAPDTGSTIVRQTRVDEALKYVEKKNDWYLLFTSDGGKEFIHESDVRKKSGRERSRSTADRVTTASPRWETRAGGGILTAWVDGVESGTGMGVNCSGSQVVVMFVFPRSPSSRTSTRVAYSIDDAVGKVVTGGAPDPQNPEIVAVKTSSSSALVRAIKRGTVLSFTTEDRSGEMMLMFVTLRGSSKALSRLSCMP